MISSPLLITPAVEAQLRALKDLAEAFPRSINDIATAMETDAGRSEHRDNMTLQSVVIPGPWPFYVTYSVETGHPIGAVRHMSMSVKRDERIPHPIAVWMIAAYLGFTGDLCSCEKVWMEDLSDGGKAINLVQVMPQ